MVILICRYGSYFCSEAKKEKQEKYEKWDSVRIMTEVDVALRMERTNVYDDKLLLLLHISLIWIFLTLASKIRKPSSFGES